LFLELQFVGIILFAASMLSLLLSLALSFWEISISVKALRLHLSDIKEEKKGNVKTVEEKTIN
jgi:PIN domain nuclease of toxin-antitoxin system